MRRLLNGLGEISLMLLVIGVGMSVLVVSTAVVIWSINVGWPGFITIPLLLCGFAYMIGDE